MQESGTPLVEWIAATGAFLPVVVGLVALGVTFWRRPKLSLHALPEHSRIEQSAHDELLPFVRLVARNGRLHRTSHGTRVLVEHFHPAGGSKTHMGSPPLGWTSATDSTDAAVVIFGGGERAVDLGAFASYIGPSGSDEWCLWLVPYLEIFEGRNKLLAREGGYVISLVIGSDDGRARRYDVRVDWDPTKRLVERDGGKTWNAHEVLASVRCQLKRVR